MTEGKGKITITDDFLFGTIMKHKEYCVPLLELILKKKIKDIVYVNNQETMEAAVPSSKSIRLDVYVEDDEKTVYDIEIQTTKKRGLRKRTRLYQALIDIRAMGKGEDYTRLKKSFIIFICTYDPFGKKRYVYTFEKRCNEDSSISLNDDATVIFINIMGSVGEISPEMKNVIDYFREGKADDEYTSSLEKQVENYNNDENWRLERMLLSEAYRNERNIGKYSHVVSMIRDAIGEFSTMQMAKIFKVNKKFCDETVKCMKEHPEWSDDQVIDAVDWDD